MKKFLTITLSVFLLTLVLSVSAFGLTAYAYIEGAYTYTLENGEATLEGVDASISGDIVIPETIAGYPVTKIGSGVLSWREDITSVTIPDGVKAIGPSAFYGCTNLKRVAIPDSVTSMAASVFENCLNLTDVRIPDGITTIYAYTFQNCESLESITIPESVTSIGWSAFANCKSLTSITIPDSVTSIDDDAFEDCSGLTSIILGDGLTSLGNGVFERCKNLTGITIPKSVTSMGNWVFFNCTSLTSVTIPDSVTSMGFNVFDSCTGLESVTMSDGVTVIKEGTFDGCTALKSVTLGDSVTSIEKSSFTDCESLTGITFPNSLVDIGEYAFRNCTKLKSITLPKNVSSVGFAAFESCPALATVKIYNKDCMLEVYYGTNGIKTVHGYKDSAAEEYAALIGAKFVEIHTHAYSNNCDKTCNICGETRTVGAHKYTNSCDTTCNVCNASRNITHTYKTTTTQATLTQNGSILKKCSVCGHATRSPVRYPKTFKLSATSYTYNGKVKTPTVTVTDTAGTTLKKDTDYTVTYASGRKNAGTYKVTVKMIGKYTGTKTLTFKINPRKLTSYKLSATSYTYNGKVKTPTVTVKNSSGTTLTKDTHYTVTYASGRKNVGTYKVTVKGKGNYTGTKTLTFKINPRKLTSYKLSATTYTYNGKLKTPTVTVKNSSGTTLTKDTHYTVTYASGRKNVGTYKVTVKGKGNYTGTKTLSFKINPPKTTVSKLTAGKKSFTAVVTKKTAQVSGYQVQYSTSKSFSKATTKTLSGNTTTKCTLKSLSAGKTYYVRVRTYKTVNGTKYYSGWSDYKSVKTK